MAKKKEIIGGGDKVTTTPPQATINNDDLQAKQLTPTQATPPPTLPTPQVTINKDDLAAKPLVSAQATPPPTLPTQEVQKPPQPMPTPQYNESDRRNQANLASQKGPEPPSANVVPTLQFNEHHEPTLVDAVGVDKTPTPPTPEGEEGEFRSYRDILAKYAPLTSDEEKKKQMRREKRNAIIGALGDGLSALSNLYFTTKGAPDQGLKPGMTDAAKKRMDDLRAKWQAEKDKYQDLMLKGLEMDREQGNFLKSYKLQLNADKRADAAEKRSAEEFKKKLPLLEKQLQAAEEELKKLIRENNIGDATWQQSVEVKKQELAWKKYELEFMKTHKGYRPKEWEEHLATERYRNSTLANKGGKGGGGKSGGNIIMSTQSGYAYNPTDAQVRQAYRWLQSRHFVSGNAKSISEMVAELQNYYTVSGENRNIYDGVSIEKSRLDDIKGGPRVDAMLGGKTRGDGSTTIDAAIGGGSGALLDGLL